MLSRSAITDQTLTGSAVFFSNRTGVGAFKTFQVENSDFEKKAAVKDFATTAYLFASSSQASSQNEADAKSMFDAAKAKYDAIQTQLVSKADEVRLQDTLLDLSTVISKIDLNSDANPANDVVLTAQEQALQSTYAVFIGARKEYVIESARMVRVKKAQEILNAEIEKREAVMKLKLAAYNKSKDDFMGYSPAVLAQKKNDLNALIATQMANATQFATDLNTYVAGVNGSLSTAAAKADISNWISAQSNMLNADFTQQALAALAGVSDSATRAALSSTISAFGTALPTNIQTTLSQQLALYDPVLQQQNRDKTIAYLEGVLAKEGAGGIYSVMSGMLYKDKTYTDSNGKMYIQGVDGVFDETATLNNRNTYVGYYDAIGAKDQQLLQNYRFYQNIGATQAETISGFYSNKVNEIQAQEALEEAKIRLNWAWSVGGPLMTVGGIYIGIASGFFAAASAAAASFFGAFMAPILFATGFGNYVAGAGLIIAGLGMIIPATIDRDIKDNKLNDQRNGLNTLRDRSVTQLSDIKTKEEEYLAAKAALDYFTKAPSEQVFKDRLIQWGQQNNRTDQITLVTDNVYDLDDNDLRYLLDNKTGYKDSADNTYTPNAVDATRALNVSSSILTEKFETAAGDKYDPSQIVYGIENTLQGGFYWAPSSTSGATPVEYVKIKQMAHNGTMVDAYALKVDNAILPGGAWDMYNLGTIMNMVSNDSDVLRAQLKQDYFTAGAAHESTLMLNEREKTMWQVWDYADQQGKQYAGFKVMAGDYQENSTNVFQTQQAQNAALVTQKWDLRKAELDAARDRWENMATTIENRGMESFNASEQRFLKAWRQWEIDTNRKIDNGKLQWNEKIRTFLVAKQNWQEDIKGAAMEQSLDKMLGATGTALNERIRALSDVTGVTADVPQMNVTELVASAMQDFEKSRPSVDKIFGEINKSITAFNTTLEIGNATHFKGFNSTTLEDNFASDMKEFSRRTAIMNNVKMYEAFKKMIEDFKTQLKESDKKAAKGLELAAITSGYQQAGESFNKDAGWAYGGKYSFWAYRMADVDGMMNRAMSESGVENKSGEDMVKFLEFGKDIDVKLFFEVQTMALEQAFKRVAGDGKSSEGYYGEYRGKIASWQGDNEDRGAGELGGWVGGTADNKRTYRGLHYEEKRLSSVQGTITTAMQITSALAGAATGSLAFTLTMQAAQQVATVGGAASSGHDVGGMIAMGMVQLGTSALGGFLGNYTYGMGKFADKAIGIAAKQAVSYASSGFKLNANGTLEYESPSQGAGLSALTSTAFAIGGAGLNTELNLTGATANLMSGAVSAIGSGIKFNDNGTLQQNYDWQAFGVGMATTAISAGAGGFMKGAGVKNQLLGNEITRALTTATTAAITGNAGVWNSAYSSSNMFNSLGGLMGDQLAERVNKAQSNEPYRDPVGDAAGKAAGGAAAFVATRLGRKDEDDYGIGMNQGFDPLGDAIGDAMNWTTQNILNPMGNFLGNAAGKLLDGADYVLDKLLSMPETLASLPSAIANKLTGGLVGSSLKLENKFEGAATSPITVRTQSGETVTIPAAQGNHILRGLLSSIGMADDTEYSMFEYRNGKVQVNNTSSRAGFTKDEVNKINKLDSFVDKAGKEFKRVQFVDKANGVDLDRSIGVFEGTNGEKMMIMKDGSVIQSVKDTAGNITNKLWTASGKEVTWTLNATNAKGAAMVNYNAAQAGQNAYTSVAGVKFEFNRNMHAEANGLNFADWALDPDRYGQAHQIHAGFDKSYMGTSGVAFLNMVNAAQTEGITSFTVNALNYGKHGNSMSHAGGTGMDIVNFTYGANNATAYLYSTAANSQAKIDKILSFNESFYNAAGRNADVYTAYEMKGGNYGGQQIFGDSTTNLYGSLNVAGRNAPAVMQRRNSLIDAYATELQQGGRYNRDRAIDMATRRYSGGSDNLMREHLSHGHYYAL